MPTGGIFTHVYNGDLLRVRQETETGDVRKFIWDAKNILLVTDESDLTETSFTLQPAEFGQLVSQTDTGTSAAAYFHFDALGSTVGLTDAGEVETDTYAYRAFGQLAASTGSTDTHFTWLGELGYWCETDLSSDGSFYSIRRREYDAAAGRFVSQDPMGFAGDDNNLYRYVTNDAVNNVDPAGLDKLIQEDDGAVLWLIESPYFGRNIKTIFVGMMDGSDTIQLRGIFGGGTVSFKGLDQYARQGHQKGALPGEAMSSLTNDAQLRRIDFLIYDWQYRERMAAASNGSDGLPPDTESYSPLQNRAAYDPSLTTGQAAAMAGPAVVLLGQEVAKKLLEQYGAGPALTVIARGGKLLIRFGGKSVELSKSQLRKLLRKSGKHVDDVDIDLDELARYADGKKLDDLAAAKKLDKLDADEFANRVTRKAEDAAPSTIPLGFTARQFDKFKRGARQLVRRAELPKGELVAHGSRIKGTARNVSDIDIALRVDEKTFFDLAEKALSRARPGTRLRETMLRRIRQNGQLSSFDLGPEFQALRRDLLDANSTVPVQFSVIKIGGKLDTGPFLPLGVL